MTTPIAAPTSTSATAHRLWARTRGLLLALAVLAAAGIALAALHSNSQHGSLDPRSADRYGSRAVAQLLKAQGVSTRVVTTLDEATVATGPDTTLLITVPDLLTGAQQRQLRAATIDSGGRTVLIAPGSPSLGILAPGVRAESPVSVKPRDPDCAQPAATRAGRADTGGIRYAAPDESSDGCYPADGLPTLLRTAPRGQGQGDTVLLGAPDILLNHRLDKEGNASLALQLLGTRPHVVWYLPSLGDVSATDGGQRSFFDLIPSGWRWAALQLALAAVLAAIWRARRLGPLVTEQLPVAIRASEATEGRARLYRKANARDRAAATLRSAARSRLAPLVGVTASAAHSPEVLVPAVSARLPAAGRDPLSLLFGPTPADDAALVRLADELDALEREVRTS
ncbi:DUF4350 domain-containing protein [Streptomyces violascens]|uniref:DUF4350 domain-containing protein n=1 Tax=Streptomyces violascens TaxID=67381 RepID=A0ABQ3QR27_9ACTN|nr:DUF4350 domain-containing protein [Streptomyces violascens]GGU24733.1 hypothetical protein GCM10010289_52700 [Streptomyces violascens]GHI39733.1 hypothetical protein Sviol_41410 [Streptomyces violascens]